MPASTTSDRTACSVSVNQFSGEQLGVFLEQALNSPCAGLASALGVREASAAEHTYAKGREGRALLVNFSV